MITPSATRQVAIGPAAAGDRVPGLDLILTLRGSRGGAARYVETLNRLGIQHRRTAYNHPEGNGYIERFHRSLKEEEVWIIRVSELPPLGNGLRVDAVAPRKRPHALLTMLYRSTDRRCRAGAAVKNLSHSASFSRSEKSAPSNAGTKHLAAWAASILTSWSFRSHSFMGVSNVHETEIPARTCGYTKDKQQDNNERYGTDDRD